MNDKKVYAFLLALKQLGINFYSFAQLFNAWIDLEESERIEVYAASKNKFLNDNVIGGTDLNETFDFKCDDCEAMFVSKLTTTRCPYCKSVNIKRLGAFNLDMSQMKLPNQKN